MSKIFGTKIFFANICVNICHLPILSSCKNLPVRADSIGHLKDSLDRRPVQEIILNSAQAIILHSVNIMLFKTNALCWARNLGLDKNFSSSNWYRWAETLYLIHCNKFQFKMLFNIITISDAWREKCSFLLGLQLRWWIARWDENLSAICLFQLQSVAIQRFLALNINLLKEVADIDEYLIYYQNIVNFLLFISCDPHIADSVFHFSRQKINCFFTV